MKKTILAVFLPAFVAACTSFGPRGAVSRPSGSAIRVGTYNIRTSCADRNTDNAWDLRKDDLVAHLLSLDLDVFGLQEVCPEQAQFLREKMPGYEYVGEHRDKDRKSGEASPVCYRKDRFEALKDGTFWLSETPDVPGVKGWGAACPRVCSYLVLRDRRTGKTFCFANTHTDHVSEPAREKGMLLVLDRMKEFGKGCPVVFTGDHNCRETEPPAVAVSRVLANALYASESVPKGPWRTFNAWRFLDDEVSAADAMKADIDVRNGADCHGPRIDYIYVTDGVRVYDCETVATPRPGTKLYHSDHYPVVATIEL